MKSKNNSLKPESQKTNGNNKRAHPGAVGGSGRNQLKDGSIRDSDTKNGDSPADAKMLRAWETINKNRGETKSVRG